MAYVLTAEVNISWVGDGVGGMTVPSAQTLQVQILPQFRSGNTGLIVVPGGDSPTTGNISTACTTLGTTVATLLNANIAQIQGFSTGGN